jgi:hypothetical protein
VPPIITTVLIRQQFNDTDLSVKKQRGKDHGSCGDSQKPTKVEFPHVATRQNPEKELLRHVEQDQTHVFIRDGRAHPHMANNGCHHARRKLVRSRVASAAVGAKT